MTRAPRAAGSRSGGRRIVISTPVHPPELGGPAVYAPSLANALRARGHAVRVVSFVADRAAAEVEADGYELVPVERRGGRLRRHRAYARTLTAVCADADLLVGLDHLAAPAVRAARRRGIPLVLRVMVDPAWELASRFGWSAADPDALRRGPRGLRVRLLQRLQRGWWRAARLLVCPSRYLRDVVLDYGLPAERTLVLHNPFHGAVPEQVPERARGRRLVLVARLVAWKRVDAALAELGALPPAYTLDVFGDGPEAGRLAAAAATRGVGNRVRFHGNRPHAEVLAALRGAAALLSLSRYEGMSHALVEAMALGTPVVATAVGGNVELLGEAGERGLLLEADGPWKLGARLEPWLATRAEDARRAAHAHVREHFDRDRVFDRLAERLVEIAHG